MDEGRLLLVLLVGLGNMPDGKQLLKDILDGRKGLQEIVGLAKLNDEQARVVTALEAFITSLSQDGADEVLKRLQSDGDPRIDTVIAQLRQVNVNTAASERLLLAIPACKKLRQEQIAAQVFAQIINDFPGQDEATTKVADQVAKEVTAGNQLPSPDQLVARVQAILKGEKDA